MSGPWPSHARRWDLLGPPLRPSPEDVAVVASIAREPWVTPPRVVLLGVTPELATLAWPAGTELVAVDRCDTMIASVWPSSGKPAGAKAVLGEWSALPLEAGSVDLVLGDAVTTVLSYPHAHASVFTEVARVLRVGGRFVTRALVPPASREDVCAIASDLASGRVGSLNALKVRLLMALSAPPDHAVRLADTWDAWREMVSDPIALFAKLGWNPEALSTIDVYRDSPTTYAFASIDELDAIARDAGLCDRAVHTPRYELGDRCPTITWRKR